jgi:hypothetical protein
MARGETRESNSDAALEHRNLALFQQAGLTSGKKIMTGALLKACRLLPHFKDSKAIGMPVLFMLPDLERDDSAPIRPHQIAATGSSPTSVRPR